MSDSQPSVVELDQPAGPRPAVYIDRRALEPLLEDAAAQYRRAWAAVRAGERYLPRCWALLIGEWAPDTMHVRELRWAGNVREDDPVVLEEFDQVIVPCYGAAYADGRRGYWCDPRELLHITREVEEKGLAVLGSIHMHADMHRFWPEHAKGQVLSERPTPMDEYLFRNGGWPLNVICHLERADGDITTRLGAWSPPPPEQQDARLSALPIHVTLGALEGR